MEFREFKRLVIRGLSTFGVLIDESTKKESDWMMNLFESLVEAILKAKFIALVSAVKMEASFERHFLAILFL